MTHVVPPRISAHRLRNSSRRNGKPASCEPCRMNKTKCDHNFPKCERCIQRGIADRCFYHPAPLTKRKDPENESNSQTEASGNRPAKRKRSSKPLPEATFSTSPPTQDEKLADAVAAETYHPGYLGPTSYEAILPKEEVASPSGDLSALVGDDESDHELSHQHPLTKSMRTQMAADVLAALRHYPMIHELVSVFAQRCQVSYVPLPLEISFLDALHPTIEQYNLTRSVPDPRLVKLVLENSGRPLEIPSGMQARDVAKLYSGENLRLESIGFLLATAGRALSFGICSHIFNDQATSRVLRSRLTDEMLRASTTCILLCTLISPLNDITLWMLLENYFLTIMVCGYSSPPCWRRVGELIGQVYAFGIHREPNNPNVPTWLLETRRRIFCSSYMQDNALSTFLGRPIRMSKRHTDVKMPLNLSDEDVVADDATLKKAINALDENGWNKQGQYPNSCWVRLRYMSSMYREEILDFAFAKIDEGAERQLLDISRRIHESWDAVPYHLRYRSTCWEEGLADSICLMLVIVYKTHWYNEFMIRKLLGQKQPLTSNFELLRVSTNILSNTLTLGTLRDRTYDVHKDFLMGVFLFGIPSASVLASALQEQQRTGQAFPPSISKAETIRMLSVLISHLEAATHLDSSSARPGEANYNLCKKASKTFTRIVDNVLDPKPRAEAEITPPNVDLDLSLDLDFFTAPALDAFEGMDFAPGEDGIDWGAMTQWTL